MTRVNIYQAQPEAYQAMNGVEGYIKNCSLSPLLEELIRTRVSQINGCAYCIQMHTKAALDAGETHERLFALCAWKESPLFSAEERAVLQLCEEVTHISESGLSDNCYQQLEAYFSTKQTAQMIVLVSLMNMWNRLAIATKA